MSGYAYLGGGGGTSGGDSAAQALGTGTLTATAAAVGSPVEWGQGQLQLSMLLEDGGAAALVTAYMRVQWSDIAAPNSDDDWNDYLREEFSTPGSGMATESQYTTSKAIGHASLPARFGITINCQGRWQRLLVYGDGATANVDYTVTYMRKVA